MQLGIGTIKLYIKHTFKNLGVGWQTETGALYYF